MSLSEWTVERVGTLAAAATRVAHDLAEEYRDDPGERACGEWAQTLYLGLRDFENLKWLEDLHEGTLKPKSEES